jgi:hypothetical protein
MKKVLTAFPAAPLPHRLSYPARDGVVVQSPQEAVQSRVVRYAPQWQDLAQLAVLAETHLGFAKSPVRLAHQAENGQQLRLGEWVFAETTALGRQNTPGYIAGQGQESDFWHPTSCSENTPYLALSTFPKSTCAEDVNRAT